jgi:multidrug efflux pump subunit AcrA (membrane-fusion protein)
MIAAAARRTAAALARHRRVTAGAAAVVVAAAGGITWWALDGSSGSAAATPSYRLVAASVGTVRQSVSTTGTIEPAQQDSVNFAASGRVTSVRVAQGDTVTAGQVLATIDSAQLRAALAQAQSQLATDQAKVDSDNSGAVTDTQLAADEAAVTAAQSQATSAQSALDGATLRSPIAGQVATVGVAVGDQVSGSAGGSGSGGNNSSSSSSSNAQFLVVGTTSWLVNASVDDTEVGLVKVGNQAQITTTGGTTVYGTVSSVGVIASSSSGTASYPVVVKVTGSPSGLHAGATGTVALIYRQIAGVLTVPTLAVHSSAGSDVVYEISGGQQVAHPVTIGLAAGGLTQIVSGIAEGDQVVVAVPTGAGRSTTGTNRTGTGTRGGNGTFGGGFGGFGGAGGGGFVTAVPVGPGGN